MISKTPQQLARLSHASREDFVRALGGIFEHSPWIAERAWEQRPFANVAALHQAMCEVVAQATLAEQLGLIRAHPELASKAAVRRELTESSNREQAGAGLTECSPEEFARLVELNRRYRDKFGFPFILAVRGHDRASVLRHFAARVERTRDEEVSECLAQIGRIALFRLQDLLGTAS